jgi:hypothetical protein
MDHLISGSIEPREYFPAIRIVELYLQGFNSSCLDKYPVLPFRDALRERPGW